jgi:16S rRNA (guanine527-N7)-methyltransferase
MKDASQLLKEGISELGLSYTEKQIETFLAYLAELKKWNRAYNLTGLKKDDDIITKHFLDSLLFSKVFPGGIVSAADIGSGAGFPGIPIKILYPGLKIYLVEPAQKKTIFLRHVCNRLGLQDIEIIDARIEDIAGLKVDAAMTRALFSVTEFVKKAKGVLRENGALILNKGPKVEEELKGLSRKNISLVDFKLPFRNIVRHLVVVKI